MSDDVRGRFVPHTIGYMGTSCGNCGRTIINLGNAKRPRWRHVAENNWPMESCHNATYRPGGTPPWDETVPRHWRARPPRISDR